MRVLVASASTADDRKTLAAVEALGKAGAHVCVGSDSDGAQSLRSPYCRERVRYPSPAEDMEGFVAALRDRDDHDVLLPLCDYTTVPVSYFGIERAPVAAYESLSLAHDKQRLLKLAQGIGLDVPETHCPRDLDEVRSLAPSLGYPCVLKPRMGSAAIGVRYPESAQELVTLYRESGARHDLVFDDRRPLIQAYVPGEVHDVCALFCRGEPRALLTQHRLLMSPRRGGSGVHNETTWEPELVEKAVALLRALRWHGPAQVEFRGGVLMEVNARFWGTLELSIRAGINFPLLACRLVIDGDIDAIRDYRVGLRQRWSDHRPPVGSR